MRETALLDAREGLAVTVSTPGEGKGRHGNARNQMRYGVTSWRTRPIFVSSTFLDMQAERDYLRDFVFPELAERLRERNYELEPIDLRWGVAAQDATQEAERERRVLQACLDEIRRSRPYLIVLVGDRYGWVPPAQSMQAAVSEAGCSIDCDGKSVTALEIEYGALADAGAEHSFFYFREPLPYDRMSPEVARRYSDAHVGTGDRASCERLDALKERIHGRFGPLGRVRSYRAGWAPERCTVIGLENWGRQVVDDLWRELDGLTAAEASEPITCWQDEERRRLAEFFQIKAQGFAGRGNLVAELTAHLAGAGPSDAPAGLCLVGESGSGKSSVAAKLHASLCDSDVLVLAASAATGPRSSSLRALLQRFAEELSACSGVPAPDPSAATMTELRESLSTQLAHVSKERPVAILLDALNEFERTPAARHMTWLPDPLPRGVRVVATATPGTESAALDGRRDFVARPLDRLQRADVADIASAICQHAHKTLPAEVLYAFVSKRRADGLSAASNPLWLTLAVTDLLMLDAADFDTALAMNAGSPEERITRFMVERVRELPADVDGLCAYALSRLERVYGENHVSAFSSLLSVGRTGWRTSDLEHLLRRLGAEQCDPLAIAQVRRGFRTQIVSRDRPVRFDFAHPLMREAARRRYVKHDARYRELHRIVSDHLYDLPPDESVRQSELMHHVVKARDAGRALELYCKEPDGPYVDTARSTFATNIIEGASHSPNPEIDWLLSVLRAETADPSGDLIRRQMFRVHLLSFLIEDLRKEGASVELCADCLSHVIEAVEKSGPIPPTDPLEGMLRAQGCLISSGLTAWASVTLAELLGSLGRYDEALKRCRQGRERLDELCDGAANREHTMFLAQALSVEAELLAKLGRHEEKAVVERCRQSLASELPAKGALFSPPETELSHVASTLRRLLGLGKTKDAQSLYDAHQVLLAASPDAEWVREQKGKAGNFAAILGDLLAQCSRPSEALPYYELGHRLCRDHYHEEPTPPNEHEYLATIDRLAQAYATGQRGAEAVELQEKAVALHHKKCERDATPESRFELASALEHLAAFHLGLDAKATACRLFDESRHVYERCHRDAPAAITYERIALSHFMSSVARQTVDERTRSAMKAREMLRTLAERKLLTSDKGLMTYILVSSLLGNSPNMIVAELHDGEPDLPIPESKPDASRPTGEGHPSSPFGSC